MQTKMINEITGFEDVKEYLITEEGEIISFVRNVNGIKLKPYPDTKGYLRIDLASTKNTRRAIKVHRLVALAFIPNCENKPQINHKDFDKKNNNVANLEWCTNGDNQLHLIKNGNKELNKGCKNYQYDKESTNCRSVIQLDEEGNILNEFYSLAQASRFIGVKSYTGISKVCNGTAKTAGGYHWKFKDR